MAQIVSDHGRRWYPATGRFRPDPASDVARALFWREARRRFGLRRAEAAIAFEHCRGYSSMKDVAAQRGCTRSTAKNVKGRLFERMGLYGNYQTPLLVVLCWPLYQEARRAAALVQTITEGDDATRLATPRAADTGAGAAVHRGDAGPLPGVWASADAGADRRD